MLFLSFCCQHSVSLSLLGTVRQLFFVQIQSRLAPPLHFHSSSRGRKYSEDISFHLQPLFYFALDHKVGLKIKHSDAVDMILRPGV